MFPTDFFNYGSRSKNMSFCNGMYTIPTWKKSTSRKMSDKMLICALCTARSEERRVQSTY